MPRRRILIIDDERVIADTLAIILCQNGYQSMVAYCGEAGLDMARNVEPDVLLSDVVLGGITGIEVACAFRLYIRLAGSSCFPVRWSLLISWTRPSGSKDGDSRCLQSRSTPKIFSRVLRGPD